MSDFDRQLKLLFGDAAGDDGAKSIENNPKCK